MTETNKGLLSVEDVSEFLLSNSYLLSALELFQETLERGQVIHPLLQFFTKDDFVDSLQSQNRLAHPKNRKRNKTEYFSEHDLQKRIKTLEYDLRMERQNLQTLRQEIQNLLLCDSEYLLNSEEEVRTVSHFEEKTLSYLVQQYLISSGRKLTAIAFNQEVSNQISVGFFFM
eukprot:TRINITY_DN4610_c0_g2_i1.p1 TRINITY_DN4610_c0_g2~~TRINITY_DN4610_c0_g2_i1.p1  ORF type:complete len:172 (+),score=31.58 TRINITY_DN4610_c0_g2_i1:144-659(+)